MSEEIKEILDKLKYIKNNPLINGEYDEENYLYSEEAKLLLKYITNLEEENENYRRLGFKHLAERNKELQQENEKLKENQSGFTLEDYTRLLNNYQELQKEHKNCTRKHWQEKCGEHHAKKLIYKSRCKKAIEYINKYEYQIYCPSPYEKEKYIMREEKEGQELLHILNGDDEK